MALYQNFSWTPFKKDIENMLNGKNLFLKKLPCVAKKFKLA